MKDQQLLKTLEDLSAKFNDPAYEGDAEQLKSWRKQLGRAMLSKDLKKHEGILMILEKLSKDVMDIDILLMTQSSEKLSDIKRDRLLDKKDLYYWFLGLFSNLDEEIEAIRQKVKEESEYYSENKNNFI